MSKRNKGRSAKRQQQQQRQSRLITGAMFGVMAVVVVLLIISAGGGLSPSPEVAQERLDLDPILGNPDAPVTIIEYSSYGCPACRSWHQSGTIEELLAEFDGQVRYIHRDFPVTSPRHDRMTANIAQCALDQSETLFWRMHNLLYTQVDVGVFQEDIWEAGAEIGLDYEQLRDCAQGRTHEATVQYDERRAREQGLRGTPAFLVNDVPVFGASPQGLRNAIIAALN